MSANSLNARCGVLRVALLESRMESLLADFWGRRLAHVLLDSDTMRSDPFHLEPRCAREEEEEDDAEIDDDEEEFEDEEDDVEEDIDEELEEYDDDADELEVDGDEDDDF